MSHMQPPFEQLGPWRLLKLLGEGGMGSVWLAERADGAFQRQVAIKLVGAGVTSKNLLQRFVAERQTLAELDHPGISRLIDGGETPEGLPYLVMDHVAGVALDDYCRQRRPDVQQRLALFLQICDAVQYAHQRLVVHRDLKPTNILVSSDAQPILLDFGIARLLPGHSSAARTSATLDHERQMTPRYAAPEQIEGGTISTATDVYALGVILFELLSGCSPYGSHTGADMLTLAKAVLDTNPAPPSDALVEADIGLRPPDLRLQQRLRGDLDSIVLKALRKQPQRRYPSVEQFAEDLQRHLKGLPVRARPDSLGYRSGKFLLRNRWPVAAATAVLLSLALSLGIALRQAAEADRQHQVAEQQREQAQHQRKLAEQARSLAQQRFSQVRSLSNALLSEVDELLELTPGTTRIRQRLIEQSISYLDLLSAADNSDPTLSTELAAGYARLADLMGNPYSPNVADDRRGREMASRALALRREMHARQPDAVDTTLDLVASLEQTYIFESVNMLIDELSGSQASDLLDEAVALLEPLLAIEPRSAAISRAQMTLLERRGDLIYARKDFFGAEPVFRELLSEVERYRQLESTTELDAKRREALARLKLSGTLWWQESDVEVALAEADSALELLREVAERQPGNLRAQRELSAGLEGVGRIIAYEIAAEDALPYYREALELSRRLLDIDRDNAQLQRDLTRRQSGLGLSLITLGELDEGITLLRDTERLLTQQAERNSSRPEAWAELAISRCVLVGALDGETFSGPEWDLPRCNYASACIDAHNRAKEFDLGLAYLSERVILARAQRVACREQGLD